MNSKRKENLCILAKALLFAVLFSLIFYALTHIFVGKEKNQALALIERKVEEKYDVILAGPSHMQYAIQPAQLFGEYGITSCNVSVVAQSIPTTYHVLKEMIERHDPELVVVDLYFIYRPEKIFSKQRVHQAFDHFPISKNKVAAIEDLVREDKKEFYIPFLLYHSRWKELNRDDYMMYWSADETYQLLTGLTVYEEPFVPLPEEETAEIPAVPLEYMEKMVQLCRNTDTQLLFTVIPYRADIETGEVSVEYLQGLYNAAQKKAEQWGVGFINGLHYLEEINFDFKTDMSEFSHMNYSGAQKVTAFYGRYFREQYAIADHSKDESYAHWYEDYEKYQKQLRKLAAQ